ncbi:hypothetical protein KJ365_11390 [Glaciecola sp. XM2]|uniref:hypothetical protein n=1 Tax=Glaciecola sp. XM2 TaxID=1914931 RepID=UPI001BDF3BF3|nr:hypothetical protein [Glaciecola sp. XM2]MBT1451483.1 hypothetical protein [Glaciecola sp. XM2]
MIASKKNRSLLLWGVLGAVFGIFALIIIAVLPGEEKNASSSTGFFSRALKPLPYKAVGETIALNTDTLCKASGVNVHRYFKSFRPDQSFLNNLVIGQMAGGSVGAAHNFASVIGMVGNSFSNGYMEAGVRLFSFSHTIENESVATIYNTLIALRNNALISDAEYNKSLASLLFNEGAGQTDSIEYDALGTPVFKNDKDKFICAVAYQLWHENTVHPDRVFAMSEQKLSGLSTEDKEALNLLG